MKHAGSQTHLIWAEICFLSHLLSVYSGTFCVALKWNTGLFSSACFYVLFFKCEWIMLIIVKISKGKQFSLLSHVALYLKHRVNAVKLYQHIANIANLQLWKRFEYLRPILEYNKLVINTSIMMPIFFFFNSHQIFKTNFDGTWFF